MKAIWLKYCFVVLFLGMVFQIQGQTLKNWRQKKVFTTKDTLDLDSLSIIKGSFKVQGIDSTKYDLLPFEGKVVFKQRLKDSVVVQYKVYPFNITRKVAHRTKEKKGADFFKTVNPYALKRGGAPLEDVFGGSSLTKGGSISRGVSFGNNQDVSVFSNMNLQLAGEIQGIQILAAITDNDIPIQPEGNSQQLQDFDKVFVQFSKDNHQLIAGDFQIQEREDRYLKLNKKAQGLSYSGKYKTSFGKEVFDYNVEVDGALSRGKFARNVIIGEEGNQGPYQLRGAQNEQFIIILSGTEKIFIDGKRLKRGIDGDYVIDYNTGELTFTTNQLITKDKRITAEFQYSDRYYGRTLFRVGNTLKNDRMKFHFNFFSEQDMKFQQLQQTLSNEDIAILALAGDSAINAVVPSIDTVEFTSSLVLYEQKDSLVEGVLIPYYAYSTDPNVAIHKLSFSFVGEGNGNYVLSQSTANGRVYAWVAPVGGLPQGDYEPVLQLVSPKQQQMLSAGGEFQINKETKLKIEGAWSNNNQNLFSDLHKNDDQGFSGNASFSNWRSLGSKTKGYRLGTTLNYQFIHKNFTSIERFRSVEFERDWNVGTALPTTNEQSGGLVLALKKHSSERLTFTSSLINRGVNYEGYKNGVKLAFPLWKGAKVSGYGNYLTSNALTTKSTFLRHRFTLEQTLRKSAIKIWEEQEKNVLKDQSSDTLTAQSFNYQVFGSSFLVGNEQKSYFKVQYDNRLDQLGANNQLSSITHANNYGASFQIKRRLQSLKWNTTFRELKILDDQLTTLQPENTLLNRVDFKFRILKGMISSSTFLEVATGNELKKEFSYVEVPAGQGVYTWNDYNNDSIQQLNEFEVAQFTDQATFIRLYQPTNEFVKTYTNQLNQTLVVLPSKFFKRTNRFGKFITRFSDRAYLRLNQKTSKVKDQLLQLPFANGVGDSSLISITSSLRNTFYFNRSNPVFGADYSISESKSKSLLVDGFLGRLLLSHAVSFRWNLVSFLSLQTKFDHQVKSRTSELFSSNDYFMDINSVEPKLIFQKSSNFRITLQGAFKEKRNRAQYGGELSLFKKVGAELTYNLPKKGRFSGGMDYISTTFSGDQNNASPLTFDMLEGLQIGNNLTWKVQYRHTFKNNLQLNLIYEGRSSETSSVIHTGNAQVQMLF